jgi:hypothetical protein
MRRGGRCKERDEECVDCANVELGLNWALARDFSPPRYLVEYSIFIQSADGIKKPCQTAHHGKREVVDWC